MLDTILPAVGTTRSTLPSRPVLLATFDVPLTTDSIRLAVESAVEAGRPLVVVNVVGGRFFPIPGAPLDAIVTPEVEASLRDPAELAVALGVATERLRVLTPRPIEALVELVAERRPSLVVLGPDPARLRRRFWEKAKRRLRERTSCLVWSA